MAEDAIGGGQQSRLELRVADAGVLSRDARQDTSSTPSELPIQIFWIYALVNISSFANIMAAPPLALVIIRYLLWPAAIVLAASFIARNGAGSIVKSYAPFSLFLLMGIVSAIGSPFGIDGLRLLIFWILGLLAATVTGSRLKPGTILQTTWLALFAMLASSAVFALAVPRLGVTPDGRGWLGPAWRGLFGNKNLLGEISGYALLFTLVTFEIRPLLRMLAGALAIGLLLKAGSQGAIVVAAMLVLYWVCAPALARQNLSIVVKSVAFAGSILAGVSVLTLVSGPLLALLGRDPTLTGRTDIWRQWLARAEQHWPTGMGPGSFTLPGSPVTADLAVSFQKDGMISTPHNMYIAVFGEVGIFGLLGFVLPLVYMFAVVPFRYKGRMPLVCGLIAFDMAIGGMSETHEVFGLGINMTLLTLAYSAMLREQSKETGSAEKVLLLRQAWHESTRNPPTPLA